MGDGEQNVFLKSTVDEGLGMVFGHQKSIQMASA